MKRTRRKTRRVKKGGQRIFRVMYGSTQVKGQTLTARNTAKKPSLTIPKGHYVVMYDPDAIRPDWIHWISSSESDILPYQGPSPPPGSGIHRYVISLHSGNPPPPPKERGGQSVPPNPIANTEFFVSA